MDFETYLRNIPNLHTWDGGKTWVTGGFEEYHLREFHELAILCGGSNATILETGAGNSTLAFLYAKAKKIVSIEMKPDLFERIDSFCKEHQIDNSAWDYRIGASEWILPDLASSGMKVDLALIDGGHGWPTVFVDFCYVYAMLRAGGILLVDDVQLYSVGELRRFLEKETKRFAVEKDLGKTIAFRKLTDDRLFADFGEQPYILERSE
jgi:precorrin-6B methylase 2